MTRTRIDSTDSFPPALRWAGIAAGTLALALAGCSDSPGDDATEVPSFFPTSLSAAELEARRGLPVPADEAPTGIAFGSCSRTTLPQPLWEPIVAWDPDIWVWLGDNVYGDTEDMTELRAKYETQLGLPGYAALLGTAEIAGTWDDHDYGENNAGAEYPMRAESQRELLDFLGVPADSPRRTREGVFGVHEWGPDGRRVKLILLDSRYHRTDPDEPGGTVLGEEQWTWLESQLTDSDAQIHLIANGIQFLHFEHTYEKWANFPAERERLLALIAGSRAPGVILLSGDRHISEIARLERDDMSYPIHEVTSSGMTHSWEEADEPNSLRVGDLVTELSFGTMEIDWEGGALALQLRDAAGEILEELTVSFDDLGLGGEDTP